MLFGQGVSARVFDNANDIFPEKEFLTHGPIERHRAGMAHGAVAIRRQAARKKNDQTFRKHPLQVSTKEIQHAHLALGVPLGPPLLQNLNGNKIEEPQQNKHIKKHFRSEQPAIKQAQARTPRIQIIPTKHLDPAKRGRQPRVQKRLRLFVQKITA